MTTLTSSEQADTTRDAADIVESRPPRGRMRLVLTVVVVAVLVVAGTAVGIRAAAAAAHERAVTAYEHAASDLASALEATATAASMARDLTSLDEQVEDPTTVETLATALARADDLPAAPDLAADAAWRTWDTDRLTVEAEQLGEITAQAETITSSLGAATEAVSASHAAWLLEQALTEWGTAREALAAALESARSVLADSEGAVADDQTRVDLTSVIETAQGTYDAAVDQDDVEALTAAATLAREHTETLTAAAATVSSSREAWQAEQDRLAAAQRAARTSSTTSNGTTNGSSSSNSSTAQRRSGASSGTTGGSAPSAGAPTQQDNRSSWEDFTGISGDRGCDGTSSSGATWLC